jgi:hypothetical protein
MVQELYETRVVESVDAHGRKVHVYEHGPVLAFANFFIDDFPMLGVAGTGKAVLSVFAALAAVYAQCRPATNCIMGVDVDLAHDPPVASIPSDKVAKIKSYLQSILDAKVGDKRDLKFWEELPTRDPELDLERAGQRQMSGRRAAAYRGGLRCTRELKKECQWWWDVITKWNRVAIILPPVHAQSPFSMADSPTTDAAGGVGGWGGGFFAGMWCACKFSQYEIENLDIMELEAMTYCIFLKVLIDRDPKLVRGRRFAARNDNQPWVAACNSNDSSKPAISVLLAWLHEFMALYSFSVELEWIKSADNVAADALSRGDRRRFLGSPPSSLVFLQMPSRSALVSKMICAKSSARSMHQGR